MNLLAFETSTNYLVIAVTDGKRVLGSLAREVHRELQVYMVGAMQEVLSHAGLSLQSIDALAVGLGPGSFTGLRVGITFVKGLSFAMGKPVVGIPSLDLIAQNASVLNRPIVPILDAKIQQIYWARYRRSSGELVRESPYTIGPVEALLEELEGDVFFLGDAIPIYEKRLRSVQAIRPAFAAPKHWLPTPETLACLGMKEVLHKRFIPSEKLLPLYLHPKECTIAGRLAPPKTGKPIRVEIP